MLQSYELYYENENFGMKSYPWYQFVLAIHVWIQEFDRIHGAGWQCIVGTDFGSFVTHCSGCFIYFCVGSLAILLFKGSAGSDAEANQLAALDTVKA